MKIYILNCTKTGEEVARVIAADGVFVEEVEAMCEAASFLPLQHSLEIIIQKEDALALEKLFIRIRKKMVARPKALPQRFGGYMKRASRQRW